MYERSPASPNFPAQEDIFVYILSTIKIFSSRRKCVLRFSPKMPIVNLMRYKYIRSMPYTYIRYIFTSTFTIGTARPRMDNGARGYLIRTAYVRPTIVVSK